ncbi:MAG TPA: RNA polymerase sigma factor [Polyangiaceae bacterium]|nr:RNA polymerase sigma factor [Polyangiaceae bacterium]
MPSSQRANYSRPSASPVVTLPVGFAGDDIALVAAIREGRPAAKAEFFNRYVRDVERMLTHILGPDRELADVLQETYTRAFASLPSLKNPSALKPWLFGVASRTAQKLLRARARRAWLRYFVDDAEEARYEPVTTGLDPQTLHAVHAVYGILDQLPTDQRVAFSLRFIDSMELTEMAEVLGVSLSTAKRRIARAQARFVAAASKNRILSEWLERGGRWPSP